MKRTTYKSIMMAMGLSLSVMTLGGCKSTPVEEIPVAEVTAEAIAEVTEEANASEESSVSSEISEEVSEEVVESEEEPAPTYEAVDPFVLYCTGIDVWGWVGTTSRSDVNLLLAVNPNTHQILMVSTPRDFYVPLSISGGAKDKLTHAGLYGTQCSADTLSMLYDIPIDYYFRVNFSGFEAIIDRLGGIDVWTDYDFTVEPIKHYVKGENHLTGLESLAFVRERHAFAAGDRVRGIHQMAAAKAVFEKATAEEILKTYEELATDLKDFYETTMPYETLKDLIEAQLAEKNTWDIKSYSADGRGASGVTYSGGSKALSVIEPNYDTVHEGTRLMKAVLEGELLADLFAEEESAE